MIKILKNVSGNTIRIFGRNVPSQGSYEVKSNRWLDLKDNMDEQRYLYTHIINGDIVVNDGTSDLGISDGVYHCQKFVSPLDVIPLVKKSFYPHYQYIDAMDYDNYLVSWGCTDTQKNRLIVSGDSAGMENGNAAPILVPFSSNIVKATVNIQGMACSTGNPSSTCYLMLELWSVGHTSEGNKITDLEFPINNSTGNIVGTWWNSWKYDVNFTNYIELNVSIPFGTRLGLKFKQRTGDSNIIEVRGITVVLELQEQ